MTLEDIKKYSLNRLSLFVPDGEKSSYYDENGHCGKALFKEIKKFWKSFGSNKDLEFIVTGEYSSDIDLDGGRSYFISGDEIFLDMVFEYLYFTMEWDLEKYESKIYNSNDITDEISERYERHSETVELKLTEHLLEEVSLELEYIPHLIKYPKSMNLDKFKKELSCIGESRIDKNSLVYKINSLGVEIPKGYTILRTVEHHFTHK
jgi:hypothetical protein